MKHHLQLHCQLVDFNLLVRTQFSRWSYKKIYACWIARYSWSRCRARRALHSKACRSHPVTRRGIGMPGEARHRRKPGKACRSSRRAKRLRVGTRSVTRTAEPLVVGLGIDWGRTKHAVPPRWRGPVSRGTAVIRYEAIDSEKRRFGPARLGYHCGLCSRGICRRKVTMNNYNAKYNNNKHQTKKTMNNDFNKQWQYTIQMKTMHN